MKASRAVCHKYLITIGLGLWGIALSPASQAGTIKSGFLYVSDYGLSQLDRYKYTYDTSNQNKITSIKPYGIGNNTSNAYFLGGGSNPVKEGVHGTANDLIIVGGNHGTGVTNITRYDLKGNLIGEIPVNFNQPRYNNGDVGIGNVLVSSDGKYMYAPLERAGYIVKVDLTNGNIVADYAFAGAHDVAIAANGDIYAANYANGNAQVIHLDANLQFNNVLVPHTSGFRPSGLSIAADGSLYVQNNTNNHSGNNFDSVLHYELNGSGNALSATLDTATSYIGGATNNALEFTFGNNIGPDGNLYIATLGGGGSGSFGVTTGYKDGIYRYNTGESDPTKAVELIIQGFTEKSGPAGPSGLSAPKYLQFDWNFVKVKDAGYNGPSTVPLPASLPLFCVGLAGLAAKRKQKANKA